jgi:hypothetical protein
VRYFLLVRNASTLITGPKISSRAMRIILTSVGRLDEEAALETFEAGHFGSGASPLRFAEIGDLCARLVDQRPICDVGVERIADGSPWCARSAGPEAVANAVLHKDAGAAPGWSNRNCRAPRQRHSTASSTISGDLPPLHRGVLHLEPAEPAPAGADGAGERHALATAGCTASCADIAIARTTLKSPSGGPASG